MHNNRVHDIRHCRALHFLLFTFPLEDDGLACEAASAKHGPASPFLTQPWGTLIPPGFLNCPDADYALKKGSRALDERK